MTKFSYILLPPLRTFPSEAEIRDGFSYLRAAGYEGVEINLTEPAGVRLTDLKDWITNCGLTIPSFLTGEAYHDGLCLSSPDETSRQGAVDRLCDYIRVAEQFGSILVVGLLQGLRTDEPDEQVANDRIAHCLAQVASVAERHGVDIVLEPVNHLQVGFNHTVTEVCAMIDRVGSTAIKPMVDTIHMNIEERSMVEPIFQSAANLRHVHLCESNGGIFGTGNIDFAPILNALEQIDYAHFASTKIYRAPMRDAARSALEFLQNEGRN